LPLFTTVTNDDVEEGNVSRREEYSEVASLA
jgi:hypothetical protein